MAVVAEWIVVGQVHGRPGAQTPCRVPEHRARRTRPFDASPGSEAPRRRLPQDCVVERDISYKLLESSILPLELLQTLRLVELKTAILLSLAIMGLLGDTDLLAGLCHTLPLRNSELRFAKLGDNLFRTVTLSSHVFHLLICGRL